MSHRKYRDIEERLLCNSILIGYGCDCWMWLGHKTKKGYGKLNVRLAGKHYRLYAHRVAYETFKGLLLATEEEIDHICENEWCINPEHMEVVSKPENLRRRHERLVKATPSRTAPG